MFSLSGSASSILDIRVRRGIRTSRSKNRIGRSPVPPASGLGEPRHSLTKPPDAPFLVSLLEIAVCFTIPTDL